MYYMGDVRNYIVRLVYFVEMMKMRDAWSTVCPYVLCSGICACILAYRCYALHCVVLGTFG